VRLPSIITLSAFTLILFTLGFAPIVSQDVFANHPSFTTAIADDPNNLDAVYSAGDTITITFSANTNATAGNTMDNDAVIGNFTFTNSNIDTNGSITGLWSTAAILVLTVITAASDPPEITTSSVSADDDSRLGSGETNTPHDGKVTGSASLTGDFGLFIAVSGGGNGCDGDCQEPTLGVNNDGKRLVDNGFSYNGNFIDVERYFTPYPLVTVDVGKRNVAEFKIYDNEGPDNVSHFELAFGLANGESIGMSKAVINWDKTFDGIETIDIVDPENVLGKVTVTTSEGNCSDESKQQCLIVKIVHTFRAPLDFNILGTNVWDAKHNAWQNYYNHGIEVVGESLNPAKEYDGINRGQIYHLTETSKTTAVDEFGNSWSLEYGLWAMDYIQNKKPIDGTTMHGYDRTNSNFEMYKYYQYKLSEIKLNELCPNCFDESFAEINDIFAYEYTISQNSLDDLEIQSKMLFESERAQKIFDELLMATAHLK